MPTKINRSVIINGVRKWIHANSEQEYAEKLMKLSNAGVEKISVHGKHIFGEYAENWFELYALPNIETATAMTYKRQLTLHLIPAFGEKALEDLTTDDIQNLFNAMTGTKSTKMKAKMVLNMILEAAIGGWLYPAKSAQIAPSQNHGRGKQGHERVHRRTNALPCPQSGQS